MSSSTRLLRRALACLTLPGLVVVHADTTRAAEPADELSAEALTPNARLTGSKSASSRIADTDPALLERTDSTPIEVLVKLDYDAAAIYDGSIAGLDATSPAVTGEALSGTTDAEQAYDGYVADQEQRFAAALAVAVPTAELTGVSLRTVYGGVRAVLPANKVADVLAIDGVVAVHEDAPRQLLTDSSTTFIGADALYPGLGGTSNAGSGAIFGVLDSGAWPEHPSFADQGNLGAPPRRFDGNPRTCDFGDNPLTPAADPFVCTNKLISGEAFLDAYLSNPARAAAEPYHTARDSNGHGTHTGSTAAGNAVDSAVVLGVERGPINGVAPGAWVAVYKVCGIVGCFPSDSAAAVEQAIFDGVDVINFSISGGTNPATDPVELAFLDAYAAGVLVAASAGNDGPGAATANHLSPWTTTVAASTQTREFSSTLTVTAATGETATLLGASITGGIATPTEIVMAGAPPYSDALCGTAAPAGSFAGKVVACRRGVVGRVQKGFNVLQGGAVGMILYNPALADIETDNHWLPTVHLADGTDFVAFMTAHPGSTATFTPGTAGDGLGDVIAAFSSRGPAGQFIKPDVTAPGVQILAGHTPTPESPAEGPPGEYFQAIAGTSMSSPHVAGAALLLAAMHPDWTPGQIKSALMTTALQAVVKEDLVTPADPFDFGAGRIDLTVAGNPGLTFDASAEQMRDLGTDPLNSIHLNLPSINVPVLPGRVETTRTATNVSGQRVRYRVEATAPDGSAITVRPSRFELFAGQSVELDVTIESSAATSQYFGEIRLVPTRGEGLTALHLPVAFVPQQGSVTLMSDCAEDQIARRSSTTCTITAQNQSFNPSVVDLSTAVSRQLRITGATGATVIGGRAVVTGANLAAAQVGTPAMDPGTLFGYIPLDAFGVDPIPVGDEELLNFDVPPFVYAGKTWNVLGVDSNGYLVVGGGTGEDNNCCDISLPDPARPNNVLAPFWTDLDGTAAPGIFATVLTDGVNSWIVVEWRLNVFNTNSLRVFQTWIGIDGVEDITFAYDPARLPADPAGQPFAVGAENEFGTGGDALAPGVLPTEDQRIVSSAPVPGGSVNYTVTVRGERRGDGVVATELESPSVLGTTIARSTVRVV